MLLAVPYEADYYEDLNAIPKIPGNTLSYNFSRLVQALRDQSEVADSNGSSVKLRPYPVEKFTVDMEEINKV